MNRIIRIFMNGILVLIPIVITVYIVFWLLTGFESIFRDVILLFSTKIYFPGMGTLLGIGIIFLVGILMQNWGIKKLYEYGEQIIEKFPVVSDIYSTLKSLLQYFSSSNQDTSEQVVVVNFPNFKTLGIVTREDFKDCPKGIGGEGIVAVFLPMSYQMGGFTIYLSRSLLTPIEMNKKEALHWIITAGIATQKSVEIKKE